MKSPGIKRSDRNISFVLDMIHIFFGILICILMVVTFLDVERNIYLFPIVFFLASTLKFINGYYRIRHSGREKRRKVSGISQILIAFILFVMTVISVISIWR